MDSLLLIPDISGFTRFVGETEIVHSGHIVSELLELIIDSDTLGMTVAEIEGDAVMFYLKDRVPDLAEILGLAEGMFIRFHEHLKTYESRRICHCGACSTAESLTLKIVAHAGPIDLIKVKDFLKPYGSDVILVHRLLKNDIPDEGYLLLTDGTYPNGKMDQSVQLPSWVSFIRGSTRYEDIGEVSYRYASLAPLMKSVAGPPEVVDFELSRNPVTGSVYVDRSVADTYELVSNLDMRLSWNHDLTRIEYERKRVNRIGTRHQCVVRGDLLNFETVSADFGPDRLVYGERLDDPPFVDELALFYVLTSHGTGTMISIYLHYRAKPFPRNLIVPIFRLGFSRRIRQRLALIKKVAEKKVGDRTNP